jgi:hypothetical protein
MEKKKTSLPHSLLYKIVQDNVIVWEGSKRDAKKARKNFPGSFIGISTPLSTIGQKWDKSK